VSLRNPEFARFFFIHEHVERFLSTGHQREGAWWYFLPLLLIGLVPWTALLAWLPGAWGIRDVRSDTGFAWPRFCLAWSAFVLVFFSVSSSKLPSYILPLFPAVALVLGWRITTLAPRPWRLLLGALALAACGSAIALWLGYDQLAARLATDRTPRALYDALGRGVKAGATVIAAGALVAWLVDRRPLLHGRTLSVLAIALAADAGLMLAFWANPGLDDSRSSASLVAAVRRDPGHDAAAPFYQVQLYDQTLPFYLGRTTTVVDYRDELALGLDAEPGKGVATTAEWTGRWQHASQAYALMAPDTASRLAGEGVPMRTVAANARHVVVARH
jgi:4-amino-4-deoxy-L-arabinose transferase-like glycosyltransferase